MSDERARLFVALELPEEVRAALVQWRAGLADFAGARGRSQLRAVAPEALHVTLCFLGWRPAQEIGSIEAACSSVGLRGPVVLSLGDPVWLPRRRPNVLAVELHDNDGALAEVQALLSRALQEGGWYEPESRPFFAHVTVARVRKGASVSRDPPRSPPPLDVRASTVVLYRSLLSSSGARYEPLARFELGSAS